MRYAYAPYNVRVNAAPHLVDRAVAGFDDELGETRRGGEELAFGDVGIVA